MTKLFHLQLVPHREQSTRNRFFGLSANLTQNRGVTQSHLGYYAQEDFQISKHDELNGTFSHYPIITTISVSAAGNLR